MDHLCDQASPSALMARAEAPASVGIKKLIEPDIIFPVLIEVEQVFTVIDCSSPIISSDEKVLQPMLDFLRNMTQMHVFPRSSGTFYLQRVAVEHMEAEQ